jgi:transposase
MEVYFAHNTINGKAYVGCTVRTASKRFKQHCSQARSGSHLHFHCAIRKYGPDAFSVMTIWKGDSREEMYQVEKDVIAGMKTDQRQRGYNMTEGGDGFTSEKARETQLQRWSKVTPDERSRLARAMNEVSPYSDRDVDVKQLTTAYQSGATCAEVAKDLNVSYTTVHRRLKQANVSVRHRGRPKGSKYGCYKLRPNKLFTEAQIHEVQAQRSTSRAVAIRYLTRKENRRATLE